MGSGRAFDAVHSWVDVRGEEELADNQDAELAGNARSSVLVAIACASRARARVYTQTHTHGS
jgi:hypothetical protein